MRKIGRLLFVVAFWPAIALAQRSVRTALLSGLRFIREN